MSFLTPLFLAAAGAVLIPVLLHLVRRLKAREVPFSTLMFLSATPIQRIRRRRLQDILLLLLRVAILILLAVVFARPYMLQDKLPFVLERERESAVILVDASYSMQHGTRFDEAVAAAVARLDEGDEWSVVVFTDAAQQLTTLSGDRAVHEAALGALKPSYRTTDFYPAFRLATEILQDARFDGRTIVMFSDFQQSGFSPAMENLTLPEGVTYEPVKIGEGDEGNRFFEAFELGLQRRGERVAVRYSARINSESEVTLSLDNSNVQRQSGRMVSFRQEAVQPGFFQGHLSLVDDMPGTDDQYFFTYEISPHASLLVLDRSSSQRSAFFLESAFDLGETSRYAITVSSTLSQLTDIDLVFVSGTGSLTPADMRSLREFAERGGSVVLAFDEENPLPPSLLSAGTARRVVSASDLQGGNAIIAQVDGQHPIFTPFAGAGAMLRPQFRRYVQVTPDSTAHVLASYDSGDPFLIEQTLGRGHVLVYTSSLSTAWTELPLSEVYVPLLYQIVRYATRESVAARQYIIGDAVQLFGLEGDSWEVAAPTGDVLKVQIDSTGTGFFRPTEVPGHYQAQLGRVRWPFSVNVDATESDLRARDTEEAYAAVATRHTESVATEYLPEDQEQDQKLWRLVLMIVLTAFVAESLFAAKR